MYPTPTDRKVRSFLSELVIDLITVCDYHTGEVFQKISWMVSPTGRLPIKKDDWLGTEIRIGTINPHVGFLAILNLVVIYAHNLHRSLICMNEMVIIDKFVKPVIEKRQVIFRTLDNPVGHSGATFCAG